MNDPAENDRTVAWAILGTGSIAATFAQDIGLAKHARLAAVCSRTSEAANSFSRRFGGLRVVPDIDALARDREIEAVYIATPNTAHFDAAHRLLSAGKPVLIEKPMVTTLAQARQVADLADEKQTFAMEALWTLFLPAVDHVRTLLADKSIGAITGVRAELAYVRRFDSTSRFFSKSLGGGSLFDLGTYPIALTLALFGEPRSVTGRWSAAPTGVDMAADLQLGYAGFATQISCGFDRNGANRFVIEGETGSIVIDAPFLRASRVFVIRNGWTGRLAIPSGSSRLSRLVGKVSARLPLPGLTIHNHAFPGNGLQFEIEAASKAILQGDRESRTMPLSASVAALGIIETILAQSAS
ncbi:MAG TPA: Gfo/Idh/MocA family oxidoreductase [Pararhizobium sp.]|uniref:Gfo/Idh/MocA family protein n=1 Tax=Pararhizobium sp. TaxID=1977563 RepID=UPI002B93A11A|nr:Gfo/Idh/MocA family oxidoreductase [Pararhizobium sp.]HTO33808.1 Gfo/Idh/MocA family oxidoreductase [Pararhizobium sp.]